MRRTHTKAVGAAMTMVVGALLAWAAPAAAGGAAGVEKIDGTPAMFEGEIFDMSDGWGEAQVCIVAPDTLAISECYASEAEADVRFAELRALSVDSTTSALAPGGGVQAASSSCGSYLKLYDGTSYTGASLWLSGRFLWTNLSVYGFDQRTSSYKVGGCSAYFADYANGGGSWYPTSLTQAWDTATSMLSGWNNDVSSVYIT